MPVVECDDTTLQHAPADGFSAVYGWACRSWIGVHLRNMVGGSRIRGHDSLQHIPNQEMYAGAGFRILPSREYHPCQVSTFRLNCGERCDPVVLVRLGGRCARPRKPKPQVAALQDRHCRTKLLLKLEAKIGGIECDRLQDIRNDVADLGHDLCSRIVSGAVLLGFRTSRGIRLYEGRSALPQRTHLG